jgi:hypothetical protein
MRFNNSSFMPWTSAVIRSLTSMCNLFARDKDGQESDVREFDLSVHTYSSDSSFRCFHVNLTKLDLNKLMRRNRSLWMRVRASTGSKLVGYRGFVTGQETEEVNLELTKLLGDVEVKLFFPFTTTLIELKTQPRATAAARAERCLVVLAKAVLTQAGAQESRMGPMV